MNDVKEISMPSRFLALTAAALALAAGAAAADTFEPKEKGVFLVNGRLTGVLPADSSGIKTAAGAATGLSAEVENDFKPSLGFTYFLTDHVAVEAIATTTRHVVRAVGPATDVKVHEAWVLPPVVSVQYHFAPKARVSPYVGAGVGYMLFWSGADKNGFEVDLEDGFSTALEVGVDVALKGPWSLNADVKQVFFETEAGINGGALKSDVELNPLVVSIGFGRKF